MKIKKWGILLGIHFLFLFALILSAYGVDNVPRINAEQLKNVIDDPGLVLLDVRTEKDWGKSDRKIVGAVRVDPNDVAPEEMRVPAPVWRGN
jgi:hypothetical protein